MIILTEAAYSNWGHEDADLGLVLTFSKLVEKTNERLIFAASSTKIKALENLGIPQNVECQLLEIADGDKRQTPEYEEYYRNFFEKEFALKHNLGNNDKLFLLTTRKTILKSFVEANKKYNIKLFFIFHANFDNFLKDKYEQGSDYRYIDIVNKCAEDSNATYLCYNPYAKERLAGKLTDKALEKLYFIHHPFLPTGKFSHNNFNKKKNTIGIYGACLNANFGILLKKISFENTDTKFLTFKYSGINQLDTRYKYPDKGIIVHQSISGYSMEQKLSFLEQMDWILLPYAKDQYKVSMSGILANAIAYEIPILALDSDIIKLYNKNKIGIMKNSIEELAYFINNELHKIDSNEYQTYLNNMKKLKAETFEENLKLLSNIIYGSYSN